MHSVDEQCSIGNFLSSLHLKNSSCHKSWYKKHRGCYRFTSLAKQEIELLMWRSGLRKLVARNVFTANENTVCFHHHSMFIGCYEAKQKKCINPYGLHYHSKKKKMRQGQYTITLEMACAHQNNSSLETALIPGQKLCKDCWLKTKCSQELIESSSCSESYESNCSDSSQCDQDLQDSSIIVMDTSLAACSVSPFKSKGKSHKQKEACAKRKVTQATKNLEAAFFSTGINLSTNSQPTSSKKSLAETDIDQMMKELKQKFLESSSYREKLQMLTLKPQSWTIQKTASYFGTTLYLVKAAIKLKKENGILSAPKKNVRKGVDEETLKKVADFYENDEYTREMPGSKDYVSVGFKLHHQKRLILCNLKELFAEFKTKFPESKIRLSKFCSLRPKWCVVAGSSGSHKICVCAKHQNVILACSALSLDYKEMMTKLVCNVQSKVCMVHRCTNCPGRLNLISFLHQLISDHGRINEEITFQQWESTDRTTLVHIVMDMPEFIEFLAYKLDDLTSHSFIAKCQAKYLNSLKESLPLTTTSCVVLADFAENYAMIVQDAIQGWHWTNLQCTIHPLVLYYSDSSGKLLVSSFCFISDDLNHDVGFVYHMQSVFISYLKTYHTNLTLIHYFSDGCAGQYKNYKNLLNLSFHQHDFGINATWNFFATSHGKSACDGVGGTVKRKLAIESLSRIKQNQITTAYEAYNFCQQSVKGIKFFFLSKDETEQTRKHLQERFKVGHTIPGTRSFHVFIPIHPGAIAFKRTAEDDEVSGEHHFFQMKSQLPIPKLQEFVAAIYDSHWWVGMVVQVSKNSWEFQVKFMTPHGPRTTFNWPARDDVCWVPLTNIIRVLQPLSLTSGSGRSYTLAAEDYKVLNKL